MRCGDFGCTPFWNSAPAGFGVIVTPDRPANAPVNGPTCTPRFWNACLLIPSITTQNAGRDQAALVVDDVVRLVLAEGVLLRVELDLRDREHVVRGCVPDSVAVDPDG